MNHRRYGGFDDPARWVLPAVLQEQARSRPDAPWIETIEGERCSFGEAWLDARRAATWFAAQGVKPGDRVAVMLPNKLDFVRAWLGLGTLGAVAVLLNTELSGAFLQHQLRNCGARLAVVDAALVPEVVHAASGAPDLREIAISGDADGIDLGRLSPQPWQGAGGWAGRKPHEGPLPCAEDTFCIMYTSGTSGPAKGVLMPHAHCTLYGIGEIEALQLNDDDRFYIVLPLFHANGLLMQLAATLLAGIPAIVRGRFSASAWLDDIRAHAVTATNMLGALGAFVTAQPPSPRDREHRLRVVCNAPNAPVHDAAFRERFGVRDVVSAFGMTEVNIPVWGRLGEPRPGAAGWVFERCFELIVADPETDRELPRGQVGEMLVRPRVPFGFMQGYHAMPEKTVEAWRNLWFHTGDAALMDETGLVTFVDRLKDCIRRRGENISASEVEAVVARLRGVAEVAAFAVPSTLPGGEDEVMLAIVPAAGVTLDARTVLAQADAELPRFARPRYLQIVTALPKTATGKVQRAVLRKAGIGAAFDREAGAS